MVILRYLLSDITVRQCTKINAVYYEALNLKKTLNFHFISINKLYVIKINICSIIVEHINLA